MIHAAGTRALAAGANVAGVLEVARALVGERPGGADVLRQHGARAGRGRVRGAPRADGRVRDDRARPAARARVRRCCGRATQHGLALVPLVAPTTTARAAGARSARGRAGSSTRCRSWARPASARRSGERRSREIIARAKASTERAGGDRLRDRARPEQAPQAADAGADGVIVGTRLVRAAGEGADPAAAVGRRGGRARGGTRVTDRDRRAGQLRFARAWDSSSPSPPAWSCGSCCGRSGTKGFDSFLLAAVIILVGASLKILSGYLPSRRS